MTNAIMSMPVSWAVAQVFSKGGHERMMQKSGKPLNRRLAAVLVVMLALSMTAGYAVEERTDASGSWKSVLDEDGAIITGLMIKRQEAI